MIVVAIIGVLAAVAIPAYQGYIKKSKMATVQNNFNIAMHKIKAELTKGDENSNFITDDIVGELNHGSKKSPFDSTKDAFAVGLAGCDDGQICVSTTNLNSVANQESVIIYAPNICEGIDFKLQDVGVKKE